MKGLTLQELANLELEEYREIVERLSKDPDFIAFIARWVCDSGELPTSSIRVEDLSQANWQIGRVSLLSEFMESLQLVHNAAYLNIQSEVNRYGNRRRSVDGDDGDNPGGENESSWSEGDSD